MRLLLITGLPGTGKTTLARTLAARYHVPLLAKDLIKEPLLDALGAGDAAHSRALSDISFRVLFALAHEAARAGVDVILEGNFRAGEHEQPLRGLDTARFVQVLCRIDEGRRRARLAARARGTARHPGHGDRHAVRDASNDAFLELPGERHLSGGGDADDLNQPALLAALDRWWGAGDP